MSGTYSTVQALRMNAISGNITKYIRKHTLKLKFITGYINSVPTTKYNIQYIIYDFNIMHKVTVKLFYLIHLISLGP
jgi:hypothetical protein